MKAMPNRFKLYVELKVEDQYPVLETHSFFISETIMSLTNLKEDAKRLAAINHESFQFPQIVTEQMGHLTIRDASWEFGLSRSYLRELCKLEVVDAFKISGIWHIRYESLIKHIYETLMTSLTNGGRRSDPQRPKSSLQFTKKAQQLRRILVNYFDASELKELCFDLDIDFEQIAGRHKGEKALELIALIVRNNRLEELSQLVQQYRPTLNWNNDEE
ncbi:MAG: hypothetical protein IPJ94_00045 [Chloroflexi bacterium]|nr:hypothetical protein [Chloroflexota bacterium]